MRPASRNPKSAQTRPHVKPLKPNQHTPKKEKRKKEKVSKAATLKISRVIKRHPNNNKKVKKYG